jgi:hypothetical protein
VFFGGGHIDSDDDAEVVFAEEAGFVHEGGGGTDVEPM